jgi:hypothetical protein
MSVNRKVETPLRTSGGPGDVAANVPRVAVAGRDVGDDGIRQCYCRAVQASKDADVVAERRDRVGHAWKRTDPYGRAARRA